MPRVEAILAIVRGVSGVLAPMSTPTDINLAQMSKNALAAEVLAQRGQMKELRGEILKQQIIAATRLDVIRLLGFIANRDPSPDPMAITPNEPQVKRVMAGELDNLAAHLRERADEMERVAGIMREQADEAEGVQEST